MKQDEAPRRTPRQARAQATVDVILEAAAQVLRETGVERSSTNLIAQVAGVSIGTLYQYFAGKDDVVRALQTRLDEAMREGIVQALAQDAESLAMLTRAVVQVTVEVFLRDPELVRALIDADAIDDQSGVPDTTRIVARALESWRAEVAIEDLSVAAFVVVQAVNAVILQSERSLHLPADALASECTRLALGYLTHRLET